MFTLKQIDLQYKLTVLENMKDRVVGLYILNDNRYMYNVMVNGKDTWYIINEDTCKRIKIILRGKLHENYTKYKFISKGRKYSFDLVNGNLIMGKKTYSHIKDKYLYEMLC